MWPDLVVRVPFFDPKGITSLQLIPLGRIVQEKIEFEYAFYRAMVTIDKNESVSTFVCKWLSRLIKTKISRLLIKVVN